MRTVNLGGYYGEDEVIRAALKKLIAERGAEAVISRKEIADASGIPFGTVRNRLDRLVKSGAIRRVFVRGMGYSQDKNVRRGYIYQEVS